PDQSLHTNPLYFRACIETSTTDPFPRECHLLHRRLDDTSSYPYTYLQNGILSPPHLSRKRFTSKGFCLEVKLLSYPLPAQLFNVESDRDRRSPPTHPYRPSGSGQVLDDRCRYRRIRRPPPRHRGCSFQPPHRCLLHPDHRQQGVLPLHQHPAR